MAEPISVLNPESKTEDIEIRKDCADNRQRPKTRRQALGSEYSPDRGRGNSV